MYLNPLGIGGEWIDADPPPNTKVEPAFEVWKLLRTKEWKENISKAHKGSKKPWSGENLKKAIELNTGKKRPEHSKLMKEKFKNGECTPPVGMATGKRTGKALENIRNGVQKRYNKGK